MSLVALQEAAMSPFLRIGLSNFDCGSCQPCQGEAVNPYCAVLVKEYVESGKLGWVLAGRRRARLEVSSRPSRVCKVVWSNPVLQFRKLASREAWYCLRGIGA